MRKDDKWYVRNTAGRVFGPITLVTLCQWARDGRIEPLAGVSENLSDWVLAPLVPELEMNWIVENNPGQFYGPTHRAVAEDLRKSGTLAPGARFYCDGQVTEREREAAVGETAELRTRVDALQAETRSLQNAQGSLRDERNALQQERDALRRERDTLQQERVTLQTANAALEREKRQLAEDKAALEAEAAKQRTVHERAWKTEVLEPEVVISQEPPPPVARAAFGGGNASLADLERQAQAELARMGAAGAKKFFGFARK